MKKIMLMSTVFVAMVLTICGCSSQNLEEVQAFAADVANKVSKNQKDSLVAVYPDAAKADSFVTSFIADSVKVVATDSADVYTAILGEGMEFSIKVTGEGAMVVTQSKGLFAYSAGDLEFGKKTGMYVDSLSDVVNAERMAVKNDLREELIATFEPVNPLKLTKGSTSWDVPASSTADTKTTYIVKNVSDSPVSGEDYYVVKSSVSIDFGNSTEKISGKDLAPGETATFVAYGAMAWYETITKVVYKLTKEEQFNKQYKFNGDEYQKFVDAKK